MARKGCFEDKQQSSLNIFFFANRDSVKYGMHLFLDDLGKVIEISRNKTPQREKPTFWCQSFGVCVWWLYVYGFFVKNKQKHLEMTKTSCDKQHW